MEDILDLTWKERLLWLGTDDRTQLLEGIFLLAWGDQSIMRLPVKVPFAVSTAVSGYKERKRIITFFSPFLSVYIKCFSVNV